MLALKGHLPVEAKDKLFLFIMSIVSTKDY
jgi:hypothetical protein